MARSGRRNAAPPALAFGDDVIQAKAVRKEALRGMTILAPMARTFGHAAVKGTQVGFAPPGHYDLPRRRRRALADLPIGPCVCRLIIRADELVERLQVWRLQLSGAPMFQQGVDLFAASPISVRRRLGQINDVRNHRHQRFDADVPLGSPAAQLAVDIRRTSAFGS
jgi:hypothetical protein